MPVESRPVPTEHVIDPMLGIGDAVAAREALCAVLAGLGPGDRLALDLAASGADVLPTQVALQLLIAGAAATGARGAELSLGPGAVAAMEHVTRVVEEARE